MFLPLIPKQVEEILAKQDSWVDVVSTVISFGLVIWFILGVIIIPVTLKIIGIIKGIIANNRLESIRRIEGEIDEKLMSVLESELPDYNYTKLKLAILSYSPRLRCPRCQGVLLYSADTLRLVSCSNLDCQYPNPLEAPRLADHSDEELYEEYGDVFG